MSIGRRFDVPMVAGLALPEEQIQQSDRPAISLDRWRHHSKTADLFVETAYSLWAAIPPPETHRIWCDCQAA